MSLFAEKVVKRMRRVHRSGWRETVCRAIGTGGQGGQLTPILVDQLKFGYSEKATKFENSRKI